jgi:hypothetical protein
VIEILDLTLGIIDSLLKPSDPLLESLARHCKLRNIAQRLKPYVLTVAQLGRLAQPLDAEQITLQAVRCLGAIAAVHRYLHHVGGPLELR